MHAKLLTAGLQIFPEKPLKPLVILSAAKNPGVRKRDLYLPSSLPIGITSLPIEIASLPILTSSLPTGMCGKLGKLPPIIASYL